MLVTHMHGDHFLEAPHLRESWGAPIWALDSMVDKMEHPEWFDYPAMIQAYGKKQPNGSPMDGVRVDRAFRPGETFKWEGFQFGVRESTLPCSTCSCSSSLNSHTITPTT